MRRKRNKNWPETGRRLKHKGMQHLRSSRTVLRTTSWVRAKMTVMLGQATSEMTSRVIEARVEKVGQSQQQQLRAKTRETTTM